MDIKSILSNIFQFAKNNQFRVKLDDTLDLEPIREALADRQNSDELLKSLLVTQNAMLVRDKVEEADKKIEITNKSFEKAKKELNFTREEIEKLDAKVKELNNFKGEKGDSPSLQELREIIEPLILPPIKGDPGKDYVLTSKDKKEIAKSIKVPIVEKTVETIIEKQPIVTNEIKEVAVTDSSEKIKEKLESLEGDERLDAKAIKNLPKPSFGGGIKRIDGALDTRIIGPTDGQALVWNSSRQVWENSSVSGGSGSPGGADTQVQFNDGGAFGGDAGLVYNKTTNALTAGSVLVDDEAYDATAWNGSFGVPTKNAVRDKLESMLTGSGIDHGGLTGLSDDDHTQYALLAGRGSGQTLIGGTSTTADLTLQTTSGVGATGADMHFLVGNNGATEAMTILNSGYVGIGTIAPTSKLTLQGTSTTDLPTYGSELLTSAGWTVTSGWTESPDDVFAHTSGGGTTALTHSATITNGYKYQISWTITGRTTGSVTITIGGESSGAQTVTGTWGPTAGSTAAFTITPTTDFNGTISLTSLKRITGVSTPIFAANDSTGAIQFELRAGTAQYNTFIGQGAGSYNTTGIYNTGEGYQSLYANTTGIYNSAQGYQSLYSNTTGHSNSAQGYQSLFSNTTGIYNSAQGYQSLYSNTTGHSNSAQGYRALFSNTTGIYNSAQGYQSLYSNTTGSSNSAQGYRALFSNTTGNSNSAQGVNALYANTTGSNNIGIGYQAGRFQADGSTPLTDPENSIYIGNNAKGYSNADDNSIVIGYNAIGLGANTTVLGNSSTTITSIYGAIRINERSSAPSDPSEGTSVIWQSDATGGGGDGDIMMKITAGGVTKTVTIVDFSTLS